MKTRFVCAWVALWCVLPVFVADQAKALAAGRRVALFDGQSLDGWDVLKCEAVVDQGEILIKAGNGLVQTRKQYSDFIIEYEWKALKGTNWDSGVYFRYDSVPAGKPWPPRYQANLRQGEEGDVPGLKGATSRGLFKDGEWNSFKLTVRGATAEMEINGKPAWKTAALQGPRKGFISLQAEVPNGGQNRFRGIYLTELK
jgi:3-keto-disaccharide hydrolase